MKKKRSPTNSIVNKRASFDYELKTEYIAGIALSGAEVKSLRMGHAHIRGAFITIKNGEAWLNNMQVTPTNSTASQLPEEKQTRARKLLLKKKQLAELSTAKDQSLTIVPTKILTKGRYIKVVLYTAKGKKHYDKRAKIKEQDTNRDIHRDIKYN